MHIISDNQGPVSNDPSSVTVVVAVFNEQEVLSQFHTRLCAVFAALPLVDFEIIYINDGSTDNSWHLMQSLESTHCKIKLLNLSRNFGKEAAMTAGLDHANSDAVILLDADLQDPPELIPQMITAWQKGFDVVNMKRSERKGESQLKQITAALYYRLLAFISDVVIEKDVGDFRLLTRAVVEQIQQLKERNRYMKGLMAWPGFKQTTIEFQRPARAAGETKWNFFQLIGLGLSGITSFSVKPLKVATWLGIGISLWAFLYSAILFIETLIFGNQVQGYPSLMLVQLWLGGVQLLAVGILGEYIGRIYNEAKGRPIYIIQETKQFHQVKPVKQTQKRVKYGNQ